MIVLCIQCLRRDSSLYAVPRGKPQPMNQLRGRKCWQATPQRRDFCGHIGQALILSSKGICTLQRPFPIGLSRCHSRSLGQFGFYEAAASIPVFAAAYASFAGTTFGPARGAALSAGPKFQTLIGPFLLLRPLMRKTRGLPDKMAVVMAFGR